MQVKPWYIDNVGLRFRGYGWQVIGPSTGTTWTRSTRPSKQAKASTDKPTLVICKTTIGKGSPNRAGTAKAHGEALGAAGDRSLTRAALGWTHEPFVIPEAAYAAWDAKAAGMAAH